MSVHTVPPATDAAALPGTEPGDSATATSDHAWESRAASRSRSATLCLATLLVAVVVYLLVERASYRDLLTLNRLGVLRLDRLIFAWALMAKTIVLLLPALIVGLLVGRRWRKRATGPRDTRFVRWRGWVTYAVLATPTLTVMLFDLRIYTRFGLHLAELTRYFGEPAALAAAGDLKGPLLDLLRDAALAALVVMGALVVSAGGCRWASYLGWRGGKSVWQVALLLAALFILLPPMLGQVCQQPIMHARLYLTMPVDVRFVPWARGDDAHLPPDLRAMQEDFRRVYRELKPRLDPAPPIDAAAAFDSTDAPDIVIIVCECLRGDVLDAGLMPRLEARSRQGLRMDHHYAGSIASEAGWFALLYSRNPLFYAQALEAGVPPQLLETFEASGYDTAYFTGTVAEWNGMERFLGPTTVHRFVRNDHGNWFDWDRAALASMKEALHTQRDRPLLAMTFLMSTHFDYRYPPAYSEAPLDPRARQWVRHHEVLQGAGGSPTPAMRYARAARFLDDQIDALIASLDLSRTIVIVTGDHGEAFGEGGRSLHAAVFSEAVARVPMVWLGAGIQPGRTEELTMHVDVLPTLLHAAAGHPVSVGHIEGSDLLSPHPPRMAMLLAYGNGTNHAKAVLVRRDERLAVQIMPDWNQIDVDGFENVDAELILDHGVPIEEVGEWTRLLKECLSAGGRAE